MPHDGQTGCGCLRGHQSEITDEESDAVKLFVGLGNPGNRYENTRHNVGFLVLDRLIAHYGASDISKSSFHGKLYKFGKLFFLKPETYMNRSGESLLPVSRFFKIDTDDVVVIHDDIDLPFGAIRFKRGGGNGGHNGLKSIDAAIGTEYIRVRIGVGKPPHKSQVADYVLQPFDEAQWQQLPKILDRACDACIALAEHELDEVRSRFSLKSAEALP